MSTTQAYPTVPFPPSYLLAVFSCVTKQRDPYNISYGPSRLGGEAYTSLLSEQLPELIIDN